MNHTYSLLHFHMRYHFECELVKIIMVHFIQECKRIKWKKYPQICNSDKKSFNYETKKDSRLAVVFFTRQRQWRMPCVIVSGYNESRKRHKTNELKQNRHLLDGNNFYKSSIVMLAIDLTYIRKSTTHTYTFIGDKNMKRDLDANVCVTIY